VLVVLRNGKVVYENYFGTKDEPIRAMSATKSIVSLAVGLLVDEEKLASIDEPVAAMLPGFANNDPKKARITYRHLLTGTSGLSPTRAPFVSTVDIEKFVVVTSRCLFEWGTSWQYFEQRRRPTRSPGRRARWQAARCVPRGELFTPLGIGNTS
jgi:CubicO group peptidase (beta-lactamase class C family)